MKIFAIIVTYNGMKWYDSCFNSLLNSSVKLNIIVVDNNSTDNTVSYLSEKFPQIDVIKSNSNLGFGRGNNLGINKALNSDADFIFLLNQDTFIYENTVSILLNYYFSENDNNIGILSPIHLDNSGLNIEPGFLNYISNNEIIESRFVNDLYFNNLSGLYYSKYINAAAWFLPKKTLLSVGGFDPMFFQYGEDDNYIQRILYHRLKIALCPESKICHDTFRPNNSLQKSLSISNSCLVEFLNINSNFNFRKLLIYNFRKYVLCLFRCKLKSSKTYLYKLFFILKNRRRIMFSRNQNIKLTNSWLDINLL